MEPRDKVTVHEVPRRQHSGFFEAAGMVLSVGSFVLGGIATAIKATSRLLLNDKTLAVPKDRRQIKGRTDSKAELMPGTTKVISQHKL